MYIEDMWPSYIIHPSYKILYNFLNDPRNINSKDVAIHNKLRQERIHRRYFCLARGNGKWLTTQRLMEEMLMDPSAYYTVRRDDIPKHEALTIEQVQDSIEYFRRLSDEARRYEQIGEYIRGLTHRQLWEQDKKRFHITSVNPYWYSGFMGIWPNSWKWGLSDDELRESNPT